MREQEKLLLEKQLKKQEFREKFASLSNREVLIKKEMQKLRNQEIVQFKQEVEADRKYHQ